MLRGLPNSGRTLTALRGLWCPKAPDSRELLTVGASGSVASDEVCLKLDPFWLRAFVLIPEGCSEAGGFGTLGRGLPRSVSELLIPFPLCERSD